MISHARVREGSLWYAVHTKPRKEDFVRAYLDRSRIRVLLPRIRDTFRKNGERTSRVEPLFPGYLFARFSSARDFQRICWAPGVKRIVGNGDDPVPVEEDVIEALAARQGDRGFIIPRRSLDAGERIRILRGPLAGLLGVVDRPCTGAERARVLVELFRQQVHVEVDVALISLAR